MHNVDSVDAPFSTLKNQKEASSDVLVLQASGPVRRSMNPQPTLRVALVFGLTLLACCAPREADYPLSEHVRAAPQPDLVPTARFDEPISGGAETAARLEEETRALSLRAAALRARGAALAGSDPGAPENSETR
jgi:hypothetical protein